MKLFYIILGSFLVFMTVMFMRCEKPTELTEVVNNTEKIQIAFYNGDAPDTYVEITERGDIKKFDNFVGSEDTPVYKCGYDGQIVFFLYPDVAAGTKNTITMEFNLQPDCTHMAYVFAGALQTKTITSEGIDYLQSLQQSN